MIAGQRVYSSLPFAFLAASTAKGTDSALLSRAALLEDSGLVLSRAALLEDGFAAITAELEGAPVHLLARHTAHYSEFFAQAHQLRLRVARSGHWLQLDQPAAQTALLSWLLGPGLLLALVRHDVWALHASAIALPGNAAAILLLGRSGASKSSIARAVQLIGGRRYTDDISPISVAHGQLQLRPRFPQLKLNQADAALPEIVPVRAIVGLTDFAQSFSITAIDQPMECTKRLLSHTVATRLFHQDDHAAVLAALAAIGTNYANRFFTVQPRFAPDDPIGAAIDLLERLAAKLE